MVMKKSNIILTVCVAVAMTFSQPSQAQRLIPKQRGIEVVGSVPLIKGEKFLAADNFGMGASLTRYLGRENYTFVMAEYEQQNMPYRSYNVKLKDALLQMGYAHPLLSDKGKNIFLYLGTSALVGYEQLNRGDALLPDGATLLDRSGLVYGAGIQTSIECFLLDRLILSSKVQAHYLFSSDVYCLRPMLSLGLRYQL